MDRLRIARMIGLVLLSIASLCPTEAVAAEKPNILFIFADDWGWGDLGCHGHPYVRTPNIDRLAREGTDFHRFTVASGVCRDGTLRQVAPVEQHDPGLSATERIRL